MKKVLRSLLTVAVLCALCALALVSCENAADTEAVDTTAVSGESIGEQAKPSHAHAYGEWTVTKAATCTEKGAEERVCECGARETRDTEMVSHSPVTDAAVAPTCTETGLTEGSHCGTCGQVLVAQETVPETGHDEVIDEAALEPTCYYDGHTAQSHCSVCKTVLSEKTTIPTEGHIPVTVEAIAPTCTSSGYTEGVNCGRCNYKPVKQTEILSKGHSFVDGVCTVCSAPATSAAVWDGTVDTSWYVKNKTEFVITTAEQLAGFAALVNEGKTFEKVTVKLGANIDLGGLKWTPIGDNKTPVGTPINRIFKGTFNGQGYTVSNFKCTGETAVASATYIYIGLFGNVSGTLHNITVDNFTINNRHNCIVYAGGLCGYLKGTMENCHAGAGGVIDVGLSTTSYSHSTSSVGGLCGHAVQVTVRGCSSRAKVTDVSNTGESYTYVYGGGLIGYAEKATVSDCYATGAVSGEGNDYTDFAYVGGLIGYVKESSILDCYATGDVECMAQSNYCDIHAGGLCGFVSGTVERCYATGNVRGVTTTLNADGVVARVGGLIARMDALNADDKGSITDCYATGKVFVSSRYSNSYP